jgi:hypothetical protein
MSQKSFKEKYNKTIPLPTLTLISRYHIRYTLLLSAVPLACGLILILLLSVFSKLNLYFLEANGMLPNEQVRDAYFKQVELEIFSVVGYLFLQVFVTAMASFVVMRWATAPFTGAQAMIQKAMENPDRLKPASRWFSESPTFDRLVWLFCLRIKSGGENQVKSRLPSFGANIPFLVKFLAAFTVLSFSTGYVLSIIMGSVYGRIVDLGLHLTKSTGATSLYFLAQQEILQDANTLTTACALGCYFVLGLSISRYMTTMLFVFSKTMHEDRFPISLRSNDIYGELAQTMNQARARVKE